MNITFDDLQPIEMVDSYIDDKVVPEISKDREEEVKTEFSGKSLNTIGTRKKSKKLKSHTSILFDKIERGRKGMNQGISIGMERLEKYIDGLCRQTYTVIAGASGSGKTTLALYSYVFRPLYDNPQADLLYIFYSLEMTGDILYCKLLSMYYWEKYGEEISVKEILSISKDKILGDAEYERLLLCQEWLNSIEDKFIVYDKTITSDILNKHLYDIFSERGKFVESEDEVLYIPNNENLIVAAFFDHSGLVRKTKAQITVKQAIDETSVVFLTYRNICLLSPIVISQLNRTMNSMDRRNSKSFNEPERSDLKETGNLEQDCEIILAIHDPTREKQAEWREYDTVKLKRIIRGIILLKNRYDTGDVAVGCCFYGRSGIWKELPSADEMKASPQYYDEFKTIDIRNKKDEYPIKNSGVNVQDYNPFKQTEDTGLQILI